MPACLTITDGAGLLSAIKLPDIARSSAATTTAGRASGVTSSVTDAVRKLAGRLTLVIFALAATLFGTTTVLPCAFRLCIARQFISTTLPSLSAFSPVTWLGTARFVLITSPEGVARRALLAVIRNGHARSPNRSAYRNVQCVGEVPRRWRRKFHGSAEQLLEEPLVVFTAAPAHEDHVQNHDAESCAEQPPGDFEHLRGSLDNGLAGASRAFDWRHAMAEEHPREHTNSTRRMAVSIGCGAPRSRAMRSGLQQ